MNKDALSTLKYGFSINGLWKYRGTLLRSESRIFTDDIENFEIRDDDVWLFGFMRSGTHWAKEMIWRIANDANVSIKTSASLAERFPFLDFLRLRTDSDINYGERLSQLKSLPSPRFLTSHLPFHILPRQLRSGEKKPKMIYISRNPKDVCVSLYYFNKHFFNFKGDLNEMSDLFMTDNLIYTPYWDNVLGFWRNRKDYNILFLKYEDLKRDLPSQIRKTAGFLGKELTDNQVAALAAHLSFEIYSKDPVLTEKDFVDMFAKRFNHEGSKGLVRKGTVGQWQQMTAEAARRLDEWTEKNLRNSDYEI